MNIGEEVSVHLRKVSQLPYSFHGIYRGATQPHEGGTVYLTIEGTVGGYLGKTYLIPEALIHYIQINA